MTNSKKGVELKFIELFDKEQEQAKATDSGRKAARAAELAAQRELAKSAASAAQGAARYAVQTASRTAPETAAQPAPQPAPQTTAQTAKSAAPVVQTAAPASGAAAKNGAMNITPVPALRAAEASALEKQANAVYAAQTGAANARYAAATEAATLRLHQAELESAQQYDSRREQVAIETAQALDNAALYAAARGDRGGIGRSQYNSIQASGADAIGLINAEQRAYAQNTALSIAQLRAQGEYQRADAMLEAAQSHLARLSEISKWAQQYDMDAAELTDEMYKWRVQAAGDLYRTDTDAAIKYAQLASKNTPSASAASAGAGGDIMAGAAPDQSATDRMFELMRLSGSPLTWLTTNAQACGIENPTQKIIEKIMTEYEKWLKS